MAGMFVVHWAQYFRGRRLASTSYSCYPPSTDLSPYHMPSPKRPIQARMHTGIKLPRRPFLRPPLRLRSETSPPDRCYVAGAIPPAGTSEGKPQTKPSGTHPTRKVSICLGSRHHPSCIRTHPPQASKQGDGPVAPTKDKARASVTPNLTNG